MRRYLALAIAHEDQSAGLIRSDYKFVITEEQKSRLRVIFSLRRIARELEHSS